MKTEDASRIGTRTRHYRDLLVWQKGMSLAKDLPAKETYGLQSQMRRAAISIPSNIAEGHGRLNDGHFRQFLATSRGSLFELQTQLELSGDLHMLEKEKVETLMESCEEVAHDQWSPGIPGSFLTSSTTDSVTC